MWKSLATAALAVLFARPALAETWHVMGATPAELLLMETDTRFVHPNGDVSVWTSSVKVGEEEPVVKARWQVACKGDPKIRPQMVVWFDSDLKSKDSWVAKAKEPFQSVVPGSRGELTWAFACGKKSWPISISGSFGDVTGAYANALEKLVNAKSELAEAE